MAFVQELAAKSAWSVVKPFLPWVIAGSVGFVGAEMYEHKAPWGLGPKRDRLEAQINGPDGYIAQIKGWQANRLTWVVAYNRVLGKWQASAADAGHNIERESDLRDQAASDAFEQGYAAGKAVGRKACGATDAKILQPGAGGRPDPVGVRDPADDFAAGWGGVGADDRSGAVRSQPPR